MKTSELIEFLKTQPFTRTQAYNLIIADLYEMVPESQVIEAQQLVGYFMYKVQRVLLPVIEQLRGLPESE